MNNTSIFFLNPFKTDYKKALKSLNILLLYADDK